MPKKIVSTIVDDDENPEVEKLRDQLEQEKAKLSLLAISEFETQKKELLDSIKDPEKREEVDELIQSGEDLNRVKAMMGIIKSGITYGFTHDNPTRKKPSGQASLEPYPTGKQMQEWDSVEDMVNYCYDGLERETFLKEMGLPYSEKNLKKFTAMTNKLLASMIQGMKNRQSTNIGKFTVMQCPNCGHKILGGKTVCDNCGRRIMTGTVEGWR